MYDLLLAATSYADAFIELSHPVALLLLGVAFGLMIVIMILGYTVISAMDIFREKMKPPAALLLLMTAMLYSNGAQAQDHSIVKGLSDTIFWLMLSALAVEFLTVFVLLRVLRFLTGTRIPMKGWSLIFLISAMGTYILVFAASSRKTAVAAPATVTKNAVQIDENNVPLLTSAVDLAEARKIFVSKCTVCHGPDGGGLVGPNLTDDHWLHGGHVNDIFRTIKYGVPEKGMRAWKGALSDQQIAQLTGYIKSIAGSQPQNAKAPEGTLFRE